MWCYPGAKYGSLRRLAFAGLLVTISNVMKNIVLVISGFLVYLWLQSCNHSQVTDVNDYFFFIQPGLSNTALKLIDAEKQKLQAHTERNPGDMHAHIKLACILAQRFSYSGNIADLYASDSLYNYPGKKNAATFRALADNCITQHRFKQAQAYIDSALALGDEKYQAIQLEFDIAMELGNYPRANQVLKSLANKNSFEYLIREAKYEEHVNGDLYKGTRLMEKAYETLPANASPALYVWTKSNLGDMYGRANRFRESYKCYLEALQKDPHYYPALKGIAWLAYSHDRDIVNAKKIIHYLKQHHHLPDYDLVLAEIAAFEKDFIAQHTHRNNFLSAVHSGMYGDMYNKYLFNLQADKLNDADKAFDIAKQEVKNRPSPEVFGWLAWAYFKKGDISNALQTSGWYVESKCYEPEILFYVGKIYRANGNKEMARKYLQEASLGSFELGPAASEEIKEMLADL